MAAPDSILQLVNTFRDNLDAYKSGQFNETQVRHQFIDPFFEALGWDINNRRGYSELFKEVVHEDAIKIGGATKAPDYCFRIGGQRIFFVEAKKPSVNIKDDISPAFQLRRYAWSAKLPLSILTDFEELAVYDCRARPGKTDRASTGRVMYVYFTEYAERWDEIAEVFSREAVLKGSFHRYAGRGAGRGAQEVDRAFLDEIERWRDMLARNIALRNPSLSTRELNFAVQRTIDRIIFLRICEDRGIETYGQLQALQNGQRVYRRLTQLFHRADERYNSGLFHFRDEKGRGEPPDELTLSLDVDDAPLRDIFRNLYYPESPYEFSVLPADILGQVYEQFLGKVIRLTAGHRAKVEEKPEVRKAGGVYYTPRYIVDYIVRNTVGKLLEGKTPKQVSSLRILDPACGSGSFLIGAFQRLLDWHLEWYVAHDPGRHARGRSPAVFRHASGEWRLTTAEKKRILLNNIYGVDIDRQAVEVTKLSLLLKVLEGESEGTLDTQLKMFKERALPDLGGNIKCGNSLIGSDFYEGKQIAMLDDEEMYRVNAFDWDGRDGFPDIMKAGGFDAVIGNPPYIRQESLDSHDQEYFSSRYAVWHGMADIYSYFIERGVSLLKPEGLFGYIVSNKWMRANYGKPLRAWLQRFHIEEITDFGDLPVFKKATTYPCLLFVRKTPPGGSFTATKVRDLDFVKLEEYTQKHAFSVKHASLDRSGWSLTDEKTRDLLEKIKAAGIPLGEYIKGKIYRGILTGLNKAFVIDSETRERLIAEDPNSEKIIKPFLAGRDIKRYAPLQNTKWLIFTRRGINIDEYPAIKRHLEQYKAELTPRPRDWKGGNWKGRKPGSYKWYEIQDSIDYWEEFERPKIILPDISLRGNFSFDDRGVFYSVNTTYILPVDDKYLLGILNSKLITFFYENISYSYRGGYLRFIYQYLEKLPVHIFIYTDDKNKKKCYRLTELASRMLDFHKRLNKARDPETRVMLEKQIALTDKTIDHLVYELYGLTEKEIRIVEGEIDS